MDLKEEILGIRCELSQCNSEMLEDEAAIVLSDRTVIVKKSSLGFFDNIEKYAVSGESPFFLQSQCISSLIGPRVDRSFLIKINSRGYLREIIVPEDDVLFR